MKERVPRPALGRAKGTLAVHGIQPVGVFVAGIWSILFLAISIPSSARADVTADYTLNGGTATETDRTFTGDSTDESGVHVLNGGRLALIRPTVTTSGSSSSTDNSSKYGLNAGILSDSAGVVTISGGSISGGSVTTTGSGANGLFGTGSGSSITMSNGTIMASGGNAHGVDVTVVPPEGGYSVGDPCYE